MKKTSKFLAIVLAVMMVMATMTTTAFAVSPLTNTGTVKITNAVAGTYELYRIFDISAVATDGKSSFITNSDWNAFAVSATTYVDVAAPQTAGSYVTPTSSFDSSKAQAFAVAASANFGSATSDTKTEVVVDASGEKTIDNLQYGYYVMKSPRSGNYTVFTVNSATTLNITEKNDQLPSISKAVNGKTGISADFGEVLTYTVTVKAAAGTETYVIKDQLPTGLTFVSVESVQKKPNGGTASDLPDTDYVLTVPTSGTAGALIQVKLTDSCRTALQDFDEIIITYKAYLNTTAEIAYMGNINIAKLVNDADVTLAGTANATVFTGQLSFDKYITDTTTRLEGAKFVLKNNTTGKFAKLDGADPNYTFNSWVDEGDATPITTGTSNIVVKGLAADTYVLIEKEAPAGYVKAADTTTTIEVSLDGATYTADETTLTSVAYLKNAANQEILNTPGTTLPGTGGIGTTIFYVLGGVLVLGAVVLLIARKRRDAEV